MQFYGSQTKMLERRKRFGPDILYALFITFSPNIVYLHLLYYISVLCKNFHAPSITKGGLFVITASSTNRCTRPPRRACTHSSHTSRPVAHSCRMHPHRRACTCSSHCSRHSCRPVRAVASRPLRAAPAAATRCLAVSRRSPPDRLDWVEHALLFVTSKRW